MSQKGACGRLLWEGFDGWLLEREEGGPEKGIRGNDGMWGGGDGARLGSWSIEIIARVINGRGGERFNLLLDLPRGFGDGLAKVGREGGGGETRGGIREGTCRDWGEMR